MSRVDIIATSRSTGETLAFEGFCRGPSLRDYCEGSPDPVLRDFAWRLSMGCHLDVSELPAFVQQIEEVLQHLRASPHPDDPRFLAFLEDLRRSQQALQRLAANQDVTVLVA